MEITKSIRKKKLSIKRRVREARLFAEALKSPCRPILAHLVPVRRCNLSCSYCSEFDQVSAPVPTEDMLQRVDLLAGLKTQMIHLSGGEPMLHPDLDSIIRRIRSHNILSGLLTNGLLLSPRRIEELNRAGLDHLQISIDNVEPDDVSKKSLKVLDRKLVALARLAEFDVNINAVLGNYLKNPQDALTIAQRARELGHTFTVGIIHDHSGQLKPLGEKQLQAYRQINDLRKATFKAESHTAFQRSMVRGLPRDWHCRAGSRYLYVCEDGKVHYCSQQRGTPGIPLRDYGAEDLKRENESVKPCALFCTVSCVHRVSWLGDLRENPKQALEQYFPARNGEWSTRDLPLPVRALAWMFLSHGKGARKKTSRTARLALRLLRIK